MIFNIAIYSTGVSSFIDFTYSGTYAWYDDNTLALLTSGDLIFTDELTADVFLVGSGGGAAGGAGGGGAGGVAGTTNLGGGGGGNASGGSGIILIRNENLHKPENASYWYLSYMAQ